MAALALDHAGQDGGDAVGDADQVDGDDLVHVDRAVIQARGFGADAGVGDQKVNGTELGLQLACCLLQGVGIGDVGLGPGEAFLLRLHLFGQGV